MLIRGNSNSMSPVVRGGGAPAAGGAAVVVVNNGGGETYGAPVYLLAGNIDSDEFVPTTAGMMSVGSVLPPSPQEQPAFEFSDSGIPCYIASGVEITVSVLSGDTSKPITLYALALGEDDSFIPGDVLGAGEWVDGNIVVTVPALASEPPIVGIAYED